jgi:hypothetical protein
VFSLEISVSLIAAYTGLLLTFSGRSTRICALKGKVEVNKAHIFVQWGI